MELEAAQTKRDKQFLDSDDEGGEMMGDGSEEEREAGTRGRKRTRKYVEEEDNAMEIEGVVEKRKRTLTAPALKRVAASKLRSFSQGRREGSTPRRDPIKNVTEEQIRMGKKIVKQVFKNSIKVNEADRHIATKMPKHLFSGKMGKGSRDRR